MAGQVRTPGRLIDALLTNEGVGLTVADCVPGGPLSSAAALHLERFAAEGAGLITEGLPGGPFVAPYLLDTHGVAQRPRKCHRCGTIFCSWRGSAALRRLAGPWDSVARLHSSSSEFTAARRVQKCT